MCKVRIQVYFYFCIWCSIEGYNDSWKLYMQYDYNSNNNVLHIVSSLSVLLALFHLLFMMTITYKRNTQSWRKKERKEGRNPGDLPSKPVFLSTILALFILLLLPFSLPPHAHLFTGNDNSTCFLELLWGLRWCRQTLRTGPCAQRKLSKHYYHCCVPRKSD